MQETDVAKAVRDELSLHEASVPFKDILHAVRKRLAREIFRRSLSGIAPRRVEAFMGTFDLLQSLGASASASDEDGLVLNVESVENILRLYERWADALDFLLDEYDVVSPHFRELCAKNDLVEFSVNVRARHDEIFAAFAEERDPDIRGDELCAARDAMEWVGIAVLGDTGFKRFKREIVEAVGFAALEPALTDRARGK